MTDVEITLFSPNFDYIQLLKDNGGDSNGFSLRFSDNGISPNSVINWKNRTLIQPLGGTKYFLFFFCYFVNKIIFF